MEHVKLLIGGCDLDAKRGATFTRENPVSDEIATVAAAADVEDASACVESAAAAFPAWSALGPSERRVRLLRAASALEAQADRFVRIASAETGATAGWIRFNVQLGASMLR